MDYEQLLERGLKKIPKHTGSGERFEIPKVSGHVEGSKTIITNFTKIADIIHRDPKHLLKYLQRELAAPALINNQKLIIGRKISSNIINEKIKKYVESFVICKDCNKPDTKLVKENRVTLIQCLACGAKHPIKSKI